MTHLKCLVFLQPPDDFHSNVEVAGCFCEWEDKILLLKRHPDKPQGNTWGVPAGKLEKNETPRMAVIREVQEEVGLDIEDDSLEFLGVLYCRLPHVDYGYHMYRKRFEEFPDVNLDFESHLEMNWVTLEEALKMPLIAGGVEAINFYNRLHR